MSLLGNQRRGQRNREGNSMPRCDLASDAPGACYRQIGYMTMEFTSSDLAIAFVESATGNVLDSVTISKRK